ncbi:MAG TPA: M20/M25/M40 family metallo-hydrolase [Terriglobales bacterium]|nr:M20/M25/M40 family metallo-hydrolase [Terriglobales bacterium]
MAPGSRPETAEAAPSIQEIARLAGLPPVQSAFRWFVAQEPQIAGWQMQLAGIAGPPFGEGERAFWLAERFRELELDDVHIDEVGNVFGVRRGIEASNRFLAISAHIDTVFPAGTTLRPRREGSRLYGPGISDNGAGVAALLATAGSMQDSGIRHLGPLVFIGNVGEEGEGDLRGMRHIFSDPHWSEAIKATLVLDGAGADSIVAEALGSRRFEIVVRGPGGHSWSDFGAPNPIIVLARAIERFTQVRVAAVPKTTFNIGVIRGGTSVNSIPESASMRVDLRSTSSAEIDRLETALRVALDQALMADAGRARNGALTYEASVIGSRPAGELDSSARILRVLRAVDSHLGNPSQVQRASTDANIPLSLGREALAIGGGGTGGGAHTLQEWFDCAGRELALKRILLATLALTGVAA